MQMPLWFVPPVVIPAGLAALIAALAIYLVCVLPSTPVPTLVVKIMLPQAEERA
jgi:hypothetical protein